MDSWIKEQITGMVKQGTQITDKQVKDWHFTDCTTTRETVDAFVKSLTPSVPETQAIQSNESEVEDKRYSQTADYIGDLSDLGRKLIYYIGLKKYGDANISYMHLASIYGITEAALDDFYRRHGVSKLSRGIKKAVEDELRRQDMERVHAELEAEEADPDSFYNNLRGLDN